MGPAVLSDFDAVWFSNPGWSMDDPTTLQSLQQFLAGGGGVVLPGDDMSWSMGHAFPMTPVTHLIHHNNGTRTCGHLTDNNRGDHYRVTYDDRSHPLIGDLAGAGFLYGNDIDHSEPAREGEEVIAWAVLDVDPECELHTPVIVGYDPAP